MNKGKNCFLSFDKHIQMYYPLENNAKIQYFLILFPSRLQPSALSPHVE